MKLILVLAFSVNIFAGILNNIAVEGRVLSFNSKTVSVYTRRGVVKVPRKSIPKYYKIRQGNYITAVLDKKDMMKRVKKAHKQAKNKNK